MSFYFLCIAESAVMKHQRGFCQPDTYCCLQPGTRSGGLTPGREPHMGTGIGLQIWGSPCCGAGPLPRAVIQVTVTTQSRKVQLPIHEFQTSFNSRLTNSSINLPNEPDSVGTRESSIVICKQQQLTACLITGCITVTSVEKRIRHFSN